MKRYLSAFLLVLLCLTPVSVRYWIQQAYGAECGENACSDDTVGQLARANLAVLGASSGVVAACSVSTDYVGDKTDYSTESVTLSANNILCLLYTPTCSGSLSYGYLHHPNDTTQKAKLCVYSDDGDSAPDSGDSIVGSCALVDTTNAPRTGWQISDAEASGTVSSGSNYWLCIISEGITAITRTATAATSNKYITIEGAYTSPPSNLDGSWSTTASRAHSMYVTIK